MRAPVGRSVSLLREVATVAMVVALAAGCGSPGPTTTPNASAGSSPGGPAATAGPSGAAAPRPSALRTIAPTGAPGGSGGPTATPSVDPARVTYNVDGDEISGWSWLRDAAGAQKASWEFFGKPQAGPITLDFELLATDRAGGGPGVDARLWLSYGSMVSSNAAPPLATPHLLTLPNTSPPGDPVGYTATGSYTIHRSDVPAGSIGVWVRIGRLGPDGAVLAEHIAVREASVRISGLDGPSPGASVPPAGVAFDVDGDEINGWWWLRDGAGTQKSTWMFSGTPTGARSCSTSSCSRPTRTAVRRASTRGSGSGTGRSSSAIPLPSWASRSWSSCRTRRRRVTRSATRRPAPERSRSRGSPRARPGSGSRSGDGRPMARS